MNPRLQSAALGALTGIRTTAGMTVAARVLSDQGRASSRLAQGLRLVAAGEAVADKFPQLLARTSVPSLLARVGAGAAAAAYASSHRGQRLTNGLIGAAAALAATYAIYALRARATRRSKPVGYTVAILEDTIVRTAGAALARRIA
jgi:uncharacterized membrane protein